METLTINLQRDETAFINEGKQVYTVKKPAGQPSGFFNAFNIEIKGKQAKQVSEMFEVEAEIYAYPDARCKSGYKFVQY